MVFWGCANYLFVYWDIFHPHAAALLVAQVRRQSLRLAGPAGGVVDLS